jgi:hypothetical protein
MRNCPEGLLDSTISIAHLCCGRDPAINHLACIRDFPRIQSQRRCGPVERTKVCRLNASRRCILRLPSPKRKNLHAFGVDHIDTSEFNIDDASVRFGGLGVFVVLGLTVDYHFIIIAHLNGIICIVLFISLDANLSQPLVDLLELTQRDNALLLELVVLLELTQRRWLLWTQRRWLLTVIVTILTIRIHVKGIHFELRVIRDFQRHLGDHSEQSVTSES